MVWTVRKKSAVALLALLLVAAIAVSMAARRLFFDRYSGQPRVVALPKNYDPSARMQPYRGPHPARSVRPQDPYPYPIAIGDTGPVVPTFAGQPEYPYACRSEPSGLGQPVVDNQDGAGTIVYAENDDGRKSGKIAGFSKDCSVRTRIHYFYLSSRTGKFLPYSNPVDDSASVNLGGESIPFVVRVETGTINRHIYVIAALRGPDDKPETPDARYWNRKLIYQFRGGVGIGRRQGRIEPDYIPDRRRDELAKGYAVAYSTANQTSNHYDIELAEDTVSRVKRQFAARYADPAFTIGIGGSGGAIQQYLIGQNRPGLIDAGIATYAYPDMITQTTPIMDCELLEYYFDVTDAKNEKWQTWSQRSWIEGLNARNDLPNMFERMQALQRLRRGRWPGWSRGHTECTRSWRNLTPQIANPRYTYFSSLFAPDIVRQVPWTYWDNLKRVYGTDESGLARRTYDNVGVQYGLQALRMQQITIAEFLHLNDSIGGWKPPAEMDSERFWLFSGGRSSLADLSVWSHHNMFAKQPGSRTPARRSVGDMSAIAAAYRSGQVFLGHLSMPIIDLRHYLEPELDMHHSMQSFSARLRMLRQQGHADNQLIWFTRKPATPLGDAFDLLDAWLTKIRSNPDKAAWDARPDNAVDRCYDGKGTIVASGEGVWDGVWNGRSNGTCMDTYPIFSNPRIIAGDDYFGDIFKCHLQSIDEAIGKGVYEPVDVRSHREELMRIFPDGVCDYPRGDAGRPEDLL